jgi:hypothetical protein
MVSCSLLVENGESTSAAMGSPLFSSRNKTVLVAMLDVLAMRHLPGGW